MDIVMSNKEWTRRVRAADRIKEEQFMKQWIFTATKEEYEDHMTWATLKSDISLNEVKKRIKLAETEEEIHKLQKQHNRMSKEIKESITWVKEEDPKHDDVEEAPVDAPKKKKKKKSS